MHWRKDLSVNTPPVPNLLLPPAAFVAQMGQFALKGLSTQVPMYKVLGSISQDETIYAVRAAIPGKKSTR